MNGALIGCGSFFAMVQAKVWAAPGVAAWVADALAEQHFLDFEEPYRSGRG